MSRKREIKREEDQGLHVAAPIIWYQCLGVEVRSPSSSSCVTRRRKVCCPVSCVTGGKEAMAMCGGHCHEEFIVHVRVIEKVRPRRQHGGGSPASCGTGGEHGGESSASCGTGGEHEAASVPQRYAHGEGVGGASPVEANGDGGNRRGKMAMAAICVLPR